ncbi:MAG: hypothetical protein Q8L85_04690 [Alphaproteobacteria bacterium]|nr:hypothetical protein [Alphaproteobacteria bacterium]
MKIYKSILLASLLLMGDCYHSCYSAGDLPNEIDDMDIDAIDIDYNLTNFVNLFSKIPSDQKKYDINNTDDQSQLFLDLVSYSDVKELNISTYSKDFFFSKKKFSKFKKNKYLQFR